MKQIGLPLFVIVLIAATPAVGQLTFQPQNPNVNGTVTQQVPPFPEKAEGDSRNGGNVIFANPITAGEKSHIAFASGDSAPTTPVFPPMTGVSGNGEGSANSQQPRSLPTLPPPVFTAVPAITPVSSEQPAAQNGQNVVTRNHRLRLTPQIFEKNLVEKLGSRFVPVRGGAETTGISRYSLPTREGTDIQLVINQQEGVVSVTGTPPMVESCLQIVRLLDVPEVPGGAVTKFVPVQQPSIVPAQRIANMVNRETVRVAQMERPPLPAVPNSANEAAAGTEEPLSGVVGPVNIDVIPDFNTMVIQGTPRDVAIIRNMIQQLETLSLENEPVIELIPMQNADSLRVSQLVQQLYQQVYANRRGAVTMLPLVKPNTILIIGRKESIAAALELIAKLDTPVNPNAAFQIFHLKHAAATELANQIQQSFQNRTGANQYLAPQVSVIPDNRTNALIVQGSPRDLVEAAAMIQQMDIDGSKITSFVRSFPLKNAVAQEMVATLTAAMSNTGITRGTMLSMGTVDAEGNLTRSNVLYNVGLAADVRSNSIIVTAPPDAMVLIENIIYQLDRLPAAESRIRVFTLINADAYTLTQVLSNLFAAGQTNQVMSVLPGTEPGESTLVGIRFQAEIRTNSIIAIGSEGDLAVAEALLLRLDAENLNSRRIFTIRLINTPADELAPILNSYITTERQIDIQNSTTYLPNSPLEQYQKEVNIVAEPISNSLIISTTPRYYDQIRKIVQELDERPLMVAIDVLIAEVDITRSRDRGVEFGLQDSILFSPATGTTMNTKFPGFRAGDAVGTQGGVTSLIPQSATGGFSFSASSESVSMFIRALETQEKTQVLSRPRLVTLHNRRASVSVGENVPYAATTTVNNNGNPTVGSNFQEVGTILDVTPRIMPDDMIALAVYVERSNLMGMETVGNGSLAPHTRRTLATTTINAMDGQTVIFAGLISEMKRSTNRSVPGLNKIPVIKHLFEYDKKEHERKELLVVLTPRIVRTREDMDCLNQQEYERMQWCVRDVVRITGDHSIRRRSDEWYPSEVRHIHGAPVILHESQLPPEQTMPLPMPMFPVIETK